MDLDPSEAHLGSLTSICRRKSDPRLQVDANDDHVNTGNSGVQRGRNVPEAVMMIGDCSAEDGRLRSRSVLYLCGHFSYLFE